jgi:hypothetical protein
MTGQQLRDQWQAVKVDGILAEAKALGIANATRRQARKYFQYRGWLRAALEAARREKAKESA